VAPCATAIVPSFTIAPSANKELLSIASKLAAEVNENPPPLPISPAPPSNVILAASAVCGSIDASTALIRAAVPAPGTTPPDQLPGTLQSGCKSPGGENVSLAIARVVGRKGLEKVKVV